LLEIIEHVWLAKTE